MIIKSPFTDYYDYVRKLGVDKSITYRRETKTLKWHGREPGWFEKYKPKWDKKWIDTAPLGILEFCGQLYRFAKVEGGYSYEEADWSPLLQCELRKFHIDDIWEKAPSTIYKSEAPVLVYLTEEMVSNGRQLERGVAYESPRLADFNFGKAVPAEKAYQELMMWFANKKQPPPIPHVDDKTMVVAKGFDKHSFRNSK